MLILNVMWKELKIVSNKNNNASYNKKDQDHIPKSFLDHFSIVCVDDKFSKQVGLYRGKCSL